MLRRSRAREVVVQLLFQHDQNPTPMPRPAVERFVRDRLERDAADAVGFCLATFDGVIANRSGIDAQISATAENWRLNRMMPVDRNVLRLATYELAFAPEPTPAAVAINEAIELSRRLGSVDSPAFVNGILDKIAKAAPHAPATA
jgi:transcription antitermination protein NusB